MRKICSICKIEKELEEFNKQKLGKHGRRANCRICQNKEHERYRQSESGKIKRNDWKKTEKGKECTKRYKEKPETKLKQSEYHKKPDQIIKKRIRMDNLRFGGNREKALIRDNYKCTCCGSDKHVQVHHKDELGRNKPKEIQNHNMDNLVTLCGACHIKQHKPVIKRWERVKEVVSV